MKNERGQQATDQALLEPTAARLSRQHAPDTRPGATGRREISHWSRSGRLAEPPTVLGEDNGTSGLSQHPTTHSPTASTREATMPALACRWDGPHAQRVLPHHVHNRRTRSVRRTYAPCRIRCSDPPATASSDLAVADPAADESLAKMDRSASRIVEWPLRGHATRSCLSWCSSPLSLSTGSELRRLLQHSPLRFDSKVSGLQAHKSTRSTGDFNRSARSVRR